ncbi:uncharacterized protein [Blastocystis hominis]|uniref:Uncharacterized protein n=1 Tax=Blastocystis hominis TaxID=12968 RepID=D8MAT7_BLAHO|nr:uncharacterized protein [Blastocystis hominis]CBK25176.2 unnamed protein product [Blastocystis hominis]|eukprot:XP_012899224.1 uncharacterized protein [Blastocystis hominis]
MNCLKRFRNDFEEPSYDNVRCGSLNGQKRLRRDISVDNSSCFSQANSFPFCLLPSLFMKYYGIEGSNFERFVNELD